MAKIQIMSSVLANQIAAGEVIERPASVVKELVENSIDANSTQIDIHVEEAGLKLIQVTDNGEGIHSNEVEQAFERHATSKLISNEDLFRIRTLGFRGEALPSIASVSMVTIESAQEGQAGRHIKLEGGKLIEDKPASSRRGTSIKVEQLFFNTPARLKYVKTIKTELAHISDTINRLALAHPEISFRLFSDETTLLKTVGNGDIRQAIAGVYGVQTAKTMKKIEATSFDFKVYGYVSLPESTRASKSYMTIIVNGRHIKNYALAQAIVDGYSSKLMVGRYPLAVVNIEMDPLLLDVNVHPTKQQVRISNEKELGELVKKAVNDLMSVEQRIPNAMGNIYSSEGHKNAKPTQTSFDWNKSDNRNGSDLSADFDDYKRDNQNNVNLQNQQIDDVNGQSESSMLSQEKSRSSLESEKFKEYTNTNQNNSNLLNEKNFEDNYTHINETPLQTANKVMNESKANQSFPILDYVGQMHGTYLFAQNEEGLFIIDQHAAQERIKYEYYRKEIEKDGTVQQNLLVPVVLEYPANDAITIRENLNKLETAGISLEEFGQNSFLIRSHPSWFKAGQEEEIVKEMIDFLLETNQISIAKFREATAIMMSCKRSIKANHFLTPNEARRLLEDLKYTENPYNCPHGRPVLVKMTNKDMEKMFKRIQDPH
ncbi:DNA mismatch repair endonuclease MutL [Marinilactibacillus psychrotolerans]|uniref:DNA mismatch repair protein MutL n=1 Tax=Marinilactibacillus psychrotolerans TaxID=191770 RepID=A0AAV3WMY4_9LACT|nr:DNA mismatch repair endonuclease MutL [Marinilactibacillus psychrotolerans]GEL67832.1 DNA mismatch repair protein MutL [Marinilactibacillus psychrotolerans]GEQ34504.1 DNA mismatch repair protein MutL [Marinilactibacillus psychrotolerans]SDC02293.1 DNA mismatch repair protein MutL [Marinilactibacillus psychrotolerans]